MRTLNNKKLSNNLILNNKSDNQLSNLELLNKQLLKKKNNTLYIFYYFNGEYQKECVIRKKLIKELHYPFKADYKLSLIDGTPIMKKEKKKIENFSLFKKIAKFLKLPPIKWSRINPMVAFWLHYLYTCGNSSFFLLFTSILNKSSEPIQITLQSKYQCVFLDTSIPVGMYKIKLRDALIEYQVQKSEVEGKYEDLNLAEYQQLFDIFNPVLINYPLINVLYVKGFVIVCIVHSLYILKKKYQFTELGNFFNFFFNIAALFFLSYTGILNIIVGNFNIINFSIFINSVNIQCIDDSVVMAFFDTVKNLVVDYHPYNPLPALKMQIIYIIDNFFPETIGPSDQTIKMYTKIFKTMLSLMNKFTSGIEYIIHNGTLKTFDYIVETIKNIITNKK